MKRLIPSYDLKRKELCAPFFFACPVSVKRYKIKRLPFMLGIPLFNGCTNQNLSQGGAQAQKGRDSEAVENKHKFYLYSVLVMFIIILELWFYHLSFFPEA
jgi:hypothetical protein